jgi:hypothetical protein
VKQGLLSDLRVRTSSVSRAMDELEPYGFADKLMMNPGQFLDTKKELYSSLLTFYWKNHVCNFDNVGSDSLTYFLTKSPGISGYVFDKNSSLVSLLMSFRIASWKKYGGLREYFLSSTRPLCRLCSVEYSLDHLFEVCPIFSKIREEVKAENGIPANGKVAWAFDSYETSKKLVEMCAAICYHVHCVSGVKDSPFLNMCNRADRFRKLCA